MCNYVESKPHEVREYRDFSAALNNQLLAYAKKYDITKKQLTGGYFNAYEYHLHNEFITQLLQAAALSSHCPKEYDAFIDSVGMSSALGLEANHKQDIVTATYWAELGWQMLDVVKAVVEGVAEGIQKGVVGTLNMVIHPCNTAQTVLHGIQLVVNCYVSALGKTFETSSLITAGNYKKLKRVGKQTKEFLTTFATELSTVSKKDIIRHISSFGTEIMVSAKLFSYAPDICRKLRMACAKAIELIKDEQKVAQTVQLLTESTCPPSCAGMYERLKKDCAVQEFTSIIKLTKHGIQRLIERGFTAEEVLNLVNNPDYIRFQTDGAKVFIQQFFNKYKVIILNEVTGEVITGLKNVSHKKVAQLGINYGWRL